MAMSGLGGLPAPSRSGGSGRCSPRCVRPLTERASAKDVDVAPYFADLGT
jgi:hypothetical protein